MVTDNLVANTLVTDNLVTDNLVANTLVTDNLVANTLLNDNLVTNNLKTDNLVRAIWKLEINTFFSSSHFEPAQKSANLKKKVFWYIWWLQLAS